jgi:hypothetical protein
VEDIRRRVRGGEFLLTGCDEKLLGLTWGSHDGRYVEHRYRKADGRLVHFMMHNAVAERMGIVVPRGYVVDHKNRNGFDNRRENLRVVPKSVDNQNRRLFRNNTSGYSGVYWHTQSGRWHAQISAGRRRMFLGQFVHFEDAAAARLAAEVRFYNGEYTTNLPGPASDRAIGPEPGRDHHPN